jgi:hypothetical protein
MWLIILWLLFLASLICISVWIMRRALMDEKPLTLTKLVVTVGAAALFVYAVLTELGSMAMLILYSR